MKDIIFVILLALITLGNHCKKDKDCHKTIDVFNSSANTIYIDGSDFPDTTLVHLTKPPLPDVSKTNPSETNTSYFSGRRCWESDFEELLLCDTFKIFILDATVVESTPWDTIRKYYMILKRYDLTLEDLQRLDWKVTYP